MITSSLYRTPMYKSITVAHRYHRYSTVQSRTYHYTCLQFTTVHSPIRSYKPYLLACLAKHPCCARSVLYTRYLHELHGYIYTIFCMQSYLHHQDINGHLLRLYIFMRDTYIRNVTERHCFLQSPSAHGQRLSAINVFAFCFCFVLFSRPF